MRKIYLLILISVIGFSGCDLDKLPETEFTDVVFWKSETDVRAACNRMYDELRGFTYMNNTWHDSRSDEIVGTSPNSVSAGNRDVPNTSDNDWNNIYTRIFTANNILAKSQGAALDEAVLNRWDAEAYFFRAYYHFLLVKLYGDAPMMLKAIENPTDPAMYAGRTPREEVIQQCYKDLEFAAEWLPTKSKLPKSDWGRVTRSAALGMIVRIGLYEGTYSKYHSLGSDYKAHLKKSIDAAEALKKEGHGLFSNYQTLFYFEGEGPDNPENVFVKVYGPNGDSGTTVHSHSRTMENSVSITRQMVDLFLYEDGLPREKSSLKITNETSYDDALQNRDPRLKMTVYSLGEDAYKAGYIPFTNQSGNGYSIKKGFMLSEWTNMNKETVDNMIIRYAEILISYAEALYEYNGSITDEKLNETVNALRSRAGFNAKLTNSFVTANNLNMIDEIRRERTVEFIDEGLRYDDIIRWKIAEKVLPVALVGAKFVDSETSKQRKDLASRLTDANGTLNGAKVSDQADMYVIELANTRTFNPARDYLYPIPLNEINMSNGKIEQNPNW
ncbi:RagB/SusD family nutrient uptake outer membrane protein [Dysgonomonas macrotermitis]|uniref:Starch-binding associating with outer membrane n=1 Tax=Dysgonomonas macrotermitis TaxID=1346286 RepID=A0A1M4XC39_9BACT|nr:RagB/SusD family nutrient uptake outer membrane protein [Dysgonomonas macrotermitis]SHE91013.1 Starch-binding associating with outer membrane [Dysgonomonas macrotermitis]